MKRKLLLFIVVGTIIISCRKNSQLVYSGPPVRNNYPFLLDKNGWVHVESRSCPASMANKIQSWVQDPVECHRYYFLPDRTGITKVIFDCTNFVVTDTLFWNWETFGNVKRVEIKVRDMFGNPTTIIWNVDTLNERKLQWSRNSYGDSLVSVYSH
jgi:hypothetical protein